MSRRGSNLLFVNRDDPAASAIEVDVARGGGLALAGLAFSFPTAEERDAMLSTIRGAFGIRSVSAVAFGWLQLA